ncbi:MAG: hypothetical protein ABSH40_00700 [Bryobacteraceae bacterium]|jgi:hypothetical protein
MATLAQIEANRLNAQQSTGPRTPQGKAVSSQNAFKSGLDADSQFCYGEKRTDFYRLQVEYFARFQPRSPEERFQVDSLIRNEWMLRRVFRAEAHLWEFHTTRASRFDGVPLGEAFHNAHPEFMRLHRRITLFEKSYKDSFAQLQALQQDRLAAVAEIAGMADPGLFADPPHVPFEEEPTDPQIGFIPEPVGQAPSPAPDPLVRLSDASQSPSTPELPRSEIGSVPEPASSGSGAANSGRSRNRGKPSLWQPRASTVSLPSTHPASAAPPDRG